METPANNLTGADLDGIQVIKKIGSGGMGDVWLGKDVELDIPVAIKVLPPNLANDQSFLVGFIREARAIAMLDHHNIVRVFQAGKRMHQGEALRVLVMEYIDGKDCHDLLAEAADGFLSPKDCAEIGLAVAKALHYAHKKGIVHRDIKPANIIVTHDLDKIKVLDFGIAKILSPDNTAMTSEGDEGSGTPLYMSPEQIREKQVDHRSDVYSLGITLYELLSGHPPFDGNDLHAIYSEHLRKELPINEAHISDKPQELRELFAQMCQKAPDERAPLSEAIATLSRFLGQASDPSPASQELLAPRLTNIVARDSHFVGRDSELDMLDELLEKSRLLSVLGPGGVGKTRLTQEYGLRSLDRFPGGVFFCDLTEARSAEEIGGEVGRVLGLSRPGVTSEDIHASLGLAQAPTLLILDNFEQVSMHAAATLGEWMIDTPNVRYLVSSREPLHLEGEQCLPLQPLSFEHPRTGDIANRDEHSPAVALFVDRAKECNRSLSTDEDTLNTITEICKELDGIPLAIELAAARSGTLAPKQILERIPRRFDFLKSRRQDQSQRQLTLRNAIDWSWNLLKPWEQSALAQCSLFQGGFFLEAAEAVLDLSAFPDAPFEIDVVESLVEKSLLSTNKIEKLSHETRFRMLESIRQYAEERLVESTEGNPPLDINALLLRFGNYYSSYASRWDRRKRGPQAVEAADRIELEQDNLIAVQDALGEINPEISCNALLALVPTLQKRGPTGIIIPRLNKALEALTDNQQALRARTIVSLADSHRDFGERREAVSFSRKALEFARELPQSQDNQSILASALTSAGYIHLSSGEFDLAREDYQEAQGLLQAQDDWISVGAIETMLADSFAHQGRFDEAIKHYLKAESIAKKHRDLRGQLAATCNRGLVYLELGDPESALKIALVGERLSEELNNLRQLAIVRSNRGEILIELGRFEEAFEVIQDAKALARKIGLKRLLAHTLRFETDAMIERGRFNDALALSKEGLSICAMAKLARSPSAIALLSGAGKAHLEIALSEESKGTTSVHLRQAKESARAAKAIAEAVNMPRIVDHGPSSGEVLKYWQWIDQVLGE